jgi:hypothetical protein
MTSGTGMEENAGCPSIRAGHSGRSHDEDSLLTDDYAQSRNPVIWYEYLLQLDSRLRGSVKMSYRSYNFFIFKSINQQITQSSNTWQSRNTVWKDLAEDWTD